MWQSFCVIGKHAYKAKPSGDVHERIQHKIKIFRLLQKKLGAYNVKTSIIGGFLLKGYIEERAVEIANYIIENNATVRQTAKQFGISKSTVHKDVTERLTQINPALANSARKVLDLNKSERHIRGGLATREKYLHQQEQRKK